MTIVQQLDSQEGSWEFRDAGGDDWLPASVPGCVHTDLMAAGKILDPFVADNELGVQWVARKDWEYRRTFVCDPELLDGGQPVELVCEGLDTLATVFVNGLAVGSADNMFRTWRFDVTHALRSGANELRVRFASAVEWCAARAAERALPQANEFFPGAPNLRKAPYHFGWDWGPMLPTAGIWRTLRLEAGARLTDVHLRQVHAEGAVTVVAEVAAEAQMNWRTQMRITSPGGAVLESEAPLEGGSAVVEIAIADPQLWWPNGLGEHPLYQVEVLLINGEGRELDRRTMRIGLRTIELRQEADKWGRSFTFVVNDVPLFAKGANWIPADSFPSRVTPAIYANLLGAAAAAHMNMIRVWGGGIYEDEAFYDLCDEQGLLVWHDFMFACSVYPFHDPAFLDTVAHEVADNVRRVRHRACLALWCGNNEMEAGWVGWGWNRPDTQDLKQADQRFFYEILRDQLADLDPDNAYWPSSPSSGLPHTAPQSDQTGDTHRWEVWHELLSYSHYRKQTPRFVSEFGFQSLPPLETISTYAPPAAWNMTSYLMEHHQRNTDGNGRIVAYLTRTFQLPRDFPALVYLTQVQQAEAMRTGVEHWRRQWPRTAGALYWQINDCWPVASWSSIDSFGRWKMLHHAARRFFAPLLLSVEDEGMVMSVWLNNDLPTPWTGTVRWSVETLEGDPLAQDEVDVAIDGVSSQMLCRVDCAALVPEGAAPARNDLRRRTARRIRCAHWDVCCALRTQQARGPARPADPDDN